MYRLTQIHGPVHALTPRSVDRWSTGNTEVCSLAFDQVRLASAIRQDVEAAQRAVALRQQPGTHTPWVETVPTRQLPQPARLSLLFKAALLGVSTPNHARLRFAYISDAHTCQGK